jgi:hypothetical protein
MAGNKAQEEPVLVRTSSLGLQKHGRVSVGIEAQADNSEERRASVFISYSREDKDFVRHLDAALKKRNRENWVDLEDIRPTEEWMASGYSGIEGADAFVFVISPESIESKSCLQELAHAIEHN